MVAELSPQAKLLIPEEWANRARCPVCGSVYLSLKRSYSDPDQLACDTCNARFEISQDGCFVRVMFPPPGLPLDLMGQWVDPSVVARRGNAPVVEARKEAQVHKQAEAETRRRALPEKPVTTESLLEQARRLLQLGNSRDKVQATLEGVRGVTEEQVAQVMAALPRLENRRSGLFWFGLSVVSILVIAIAVVIGLGLAQRQSQRAPSESNLPAGVRVLLSSGSAIMDIPPVNVWRLESTGSVTCPTQPANAARMFGGESNMYSRLKAGWTFLSAKPHNILVPQGMRAEYLLVGKEPRMSPVYGPVRLENAIYVDIYCP